MTHRTGRARSAATGAAALLAVCLGITTVQAQEPDDAATPDAPEAELPPAETPAPDVPPTEVTEVNLVVDLEVEGLRRVEREAAMQGVLTRAGKPFDEKQITADIHTLWRTGFFRDIRVLKERVPGGVRVIIQVVEKPSIREVALEGNDDLSDDDVNAVIDVKPYTILNVENIKRNVQKIKDLYIEKGYFLAKVDYRTEPVPGAEQEVKVVFVIDENAKVMVRQITFEGNQSIPSSEIKGVLQTREGDELSFITQSGTYKQEFFQTDLFRIQALYYDRGFVAVKIGEPTATISRDRRFIYLSVPIEEGKIYDIGTIGFSGDVRLEDEKGKVLVDEEKLRERMSIRTGERFNRTNLFEDIQKLTDAYKDQGYAYANVTPNSTLNPDKQTVDLDLQVERGDIVTIERIEISGNTKTRDKVIRREMQIVEGEKYSASGLNASRARIFQLGYFETVDISTSRGSRADTMNVTVDIKEKSTGTFQIGAGFSSVESFIATAQIAQNNFLGNGQLLSVSAQLSFGDFARQLATLQFYEPYLFDTELSFGFNAYITQRYYPEFQRNANGVSPSFGYPITPDLRFTAGYTFEDIDITTGSGGATGGQAFSELYKDGLNSAVSLSLAYDSRDNRLFPSSGHYDVASAEFSHPVFRFMQGEGIEYNRLQLDMRYYYPLPLQFVFKVNLQLGYVFTFSGDPVPLSERFFPGGIYSVRGFEPRGLGPRVPTLSTGDPTSASREFPVGGNKQLVLNLEVEFPIIEVAGIKGVIFFDAGNAYDDAQNFFYIDTPVSKRPNAYLFADTAAIDGGPPLGLYYSFGFGFRWFSPIGPLRFEWGIPITKANLNDRGIIFEFTIGNFF